MASLKLLPEKVMKLLQRWHDGSGILEMAEWEHNQSKDARHPSHSESWTKEMAKDLRTGK